MGDQLRTKLVSAVILVIVFAAGGLVGAAVVTQPAPGSDAEAGTVAAVDADGGEGDGSASDEDRGERRRPRTWFEMAGATEEQEEHIRGTILKEHQSRMQALDQDSVVQAFEARLDTIGSNWRSAHRGLEAYYDPKEDSILEMTRAQIRAVLHPEAQVVYDSLWAAERARKERNNRGNDDRR